MSKRKLARRGNYVIGYGRPPKSGQFKPGESGNTGGRPKGLRPLGSLLHEILRQKVPVTENGKTRRIPVQEVMFRRLAKDAMRADKGAIKLVLNLVDRYSDSPEATLQLREMLAEDRAILAQYLTEPDDLLPTPVSEPTKTRPKK